MVFGIDSHKQSLAIAAVDEAGGLVAEAVFATTDQGLPGSRPVPRLRRRMATAGSRSRARRGYAAALTERLLVAGELVVAVPASLTRPERRHLRGRGHSDARDALAIGRAALAEPGLPELTLHDATQDLKLVSDERLSSAATARGRRTGSTWISSWSSPCTSRPAVPRPAGCRRVTGRSVSHRRPAKNDRATADVASYVRRCAASLRQLAAA